MPALIPVTDDIGAREEMCAACGKIIGIVDFIVRCWPDPNGPFPVVIDYVHLDCDAELKDHIEEVRTGRHPHAARLN
jgi:hypothetical protein